MATKKENKKENVYANGQFTGVYKGANGDLLTATHMIYEVDSDELMVAVDDGFKLLYTFLYDQYRSFQSQQKDLFAEWETIFKALGRTYNTKKSKDNVKLLEDCGLLKQIKMPNSNARIKIVADVSLKNIRFINPDYDAWRAEQEANNAERVTEYAAFHEEKEKAKHQAKQPHNNTKSKTEVRDESRDEIAVDNAKTPHDPNAAGCRDSEIKIVDVKPESKTLWQLHSHALITQNPKFNDLSPGHQSSVMSELSECNAVSYKAIKEIFNMSVAQFVKAEVEVSKPTVKHVGRVCSGCYPVEVGNGWSCINNKCSNHNAEYENSKLDDMDSIPF